MNRKCLNSHAFEFEAINLPLSLHFIVSRNVERQMLGRLQNAENTPVAVVIPSRCIHLVKSISTVMYTL